MNSVTFENLPELPFAAAESINQLREHHDYKL